MNPPSSPPPSPPPKGGPPRGALVGVGVIVLVGVAVGAFLLGRGSSTPITPGPQPSTPGSPPVASSTPSPGTGVLQSLPPAPTKPQQMQAPEQVSPAFWVDVYAPGKVRDALAGNAWVKEQLHKPLGQGFVGGWGALLDTRGEDLGGGFKGTLFEVLSGQLLAAPFRVVWFAGQGQSSTPAIIVPQPGNTAMAAFDSVNAAVRRSEMTAAACAGSASEVPKEGFKLERWLVAEQALWAARTPDKLVFARSAPALLQGLCEPHLDLAAPQGVDVELGFDPAQLGHEAQALTHVMGTEQGLRLQFAAEGNRLVGRGITGPVGGESRLDRAALSDSLLKLVPEDMPVLLALQLKLPEQLDAATLKSFWSEEHYAGALLTRQVALLWRPRGDASLPTEVALVWGRPEDAAALGKLFSGPNALQSAALCGQQVLASTPEVLAGLRRACEGQGPNMLNASAPVVQGLREQGSVAFGLNTGRLLGTLVADGYASQLPQPPAKTPQPRVAPPEIEAARRDLETLPYIGLRGTVDGNRLVPGGFGS